MNPTTNMDLGFCKYSGPFASNHLFHCAKSDRLRVLFLLLLLLTTATLLGGCSVGGGYGTRHRPPEEFLSDQTNKLYLTVLYTSGHPKMADVTCVCHYRYSSASDWHHSSMKVVEIQGKEMELEVELTPVGSVANGDNMLYYISGNIRGHSFERFSRENPRSVPFKP